MKLMVLQMVEKINTSIILFSYLFFNALFINVLGQIETPTFISSNMVLQQEFNAPLWGWGEPDYPITITTSWDNIVYQTSTDYKGDWFVRVKTPTAGGPYEITINNDTLSKVMIGEVWVCSGQSNMEMQVGGTGNVKNYKVCKRYTRY